MTKDDPGYHFWPVSSDLSYIYDSLVKFYNSMDMLSNCVTDQRIRTCACAGMDTDITFSAPHTALDRAYICLLYYIVISFR